MTYRCNLARVSSLAQALFLIHPGIGMLEWLCAIPAMIGILGGAKAVNRIP